MRWIEQYKLLQSREVNNLSYKVSLHIEAGWQPYGVPTQLRQSLVQPMVKYAEHKERHHIDSELQKVNEFLEEYIESMSMVTEEMGKIFPDQPNPISTSDDQPTTPLPRPEPNCTIIGHRHRVIDCPNGRRGRNV